MPDQTPDPLQRGLRSLASSAAQSAHGPAPAEIRRRGTRRHRLRITAVTALSTAAVVAVGAVAFGADRDIGREPVPPATQDTTVPAPPVAAPLTDANLPTAAELPGFNELTGWRTTSTTPGDRQARISICQQSSLADLGAVDVWSREYRQTTDLPPNTDADPNAVPGYTGILVAQFTDQDAAADAYEQVATWIEDCPGGPPTPLGEVVRAQNWGGDTFLLTYPKGTVNPAYPDEVGYQDDAVLDTQGCGIAGSRIVLVVQTQLGQDYDYAAGKSPIDGALDTALTRLADGADV